MTSPSDSNRYQNDLELGLRPELPDSEPTTQEVLQKPWKYVGYSGYSKFLASDDDFFILRRFRTLNSRIALLLQNEIVALEESLERMDKERNSKRAEDMHNGSFQDDDKARTALLHTIKDKLREYNCFIFEQSKLHTYAEAPGKDIQSIRNWHHNYDYCAIDENEQKYLQQTTDLVCIVQKERVPLRQVIDNSARFRTLSWWKTKGQVNDPHNEISYFSDKHIDMFVSGVIAGIGVAMLLVPIWILQAIQNRTSKLIVITIFLFIFLMVLSFAMTTKPFEALGSTAAYAAVLMVFLQFGS